MLEEAEVMEITLRKLNLNRAKIIGVIIIYDIDTNMLKKLSEKMGLKFVGKDDNVAIAKMMEISKPNRPEVREFFQRQLESIHNDKWANKEYVPVQK